MMKTSKIIKSFDKSIDKWIIEINKQQYQKAKKIASSGANQCREFILNPTADLDEIKNSCLFYGIFFRGLEELTELAEIVANYEWYNNRDYVESAWLLIQNCKERFESTCERLNLSPEIKSTNGSFIEILEKDFVTLFGPGIYTSPEIIIKKNICSICKSDYRFCPHLPNHIYAGKICRMLPTEIKPGNCIMILPKPKDLRCRIWPWNAEKNDKGYIIKNVPLVFFFHIDDFLDEDYYSSVGKCLATTLILDDIDIFE